MKDKKNGQPMRIAKIALFFYNPAIDYFIILPQEPPVLRVLQGLPVLLRVLPVLLRVLPVLQVLLQEPQVLQVLQVPLLQEPQELPVLPLSWLLPSGPACSLLPRWLKKPIKAR
jgi:hypothetical protein